MTENPIDWLNIAERFGFPSFCLLAILLGGWRICRWLGDNIVKPMTDAHLQFIGSLDTTQRQLASSCQKQADAVDKISDTLQTITEAHGQKIDDIHAVVVRKGNQ